MNSVAQTRIFARSLDDGRQLLVYSMRLEFASELAMVLPLPVPQGVAEDAVEFRDLSACPTFFEKLDSLFPVSGFAPAFLARGPARAAPKLEVHRVGEFEASFVPSRADFARLDSRFRLPDAAFDRLPQYADHGFAVFKLRPGRRGLFASAAAQRVHPMAFAFPRRAPQRIFFPTLHVHDGELHARAAFDHSLYCQPGDTLAGLLRWEHSKQVAGSVLDAAEAPDVAALAAGVFRETLFGTLPNRDYELAPPRHAAALLSGSGDCYEYEARCSWAFSFCPESLPHRTWKSTSEQRFDLVQRGLAEGLPALVARHREDWKLCSLSPELPVHFMNGPQLFRGTDYMNGTSQLVPGKARVNFTAFSDSVEPQHVVLGFSELPSRALTDTIRAELATLLDRALTMRDVRPS